MNAYERVAVRSDAEMGHSPAQMVAVGSQRLHKERPVGETASHVVRLRGLSGAASGWQQQHV